MMPGVSGSATRLVTDERRLRISDATLTADELKSLLSRLPQRKGDPVVRSVEFSNVVVKDAIALPRLHVLEGLLISNCQFADDVDLSQLRVWGSTVIESSTFKGISNWRGARFKRRIAFRDCRFEGEASFEDCRFDDSVDFTQSSQSVRVEIRDDDGLRSGRLPTEITGCLFEGALNFSHSNILGSFSMRRSIFRGPVKCVRTAFHDRADWIDTEFHGVAIFNRARFLDEALFIGTDFLLDRVEHANIFDRSPASFHGVQFCGEAHISARFRGHADFKGSVFRSKAAFTDSTFDHGVQFNRAIFQATAGFHMVHFSSGVDFANTTFEGLCVWTQVHFGKSTRCTAAVFSNGIDGSRAAFESDVSFEYATLAGDVDLSRSAWLGQATFMNAEIDCGEVNLSRSVFARYLEIRLSANHIELFRTRLEGGGHLALIDSTAVTFEECDVLAPLTISSISESGEQASVASLRRTNVSALTVEDVSLRSCLFSGAHGLDQLRIYGGSSFGTTPRGGRSRRAVIAEEVLLRRPSKNGRPNGWSRLDLPIPSSLQHIEPLPYSKVAAIYRDLRKGREDRKDEPGAADFYYGEMEMRRLDPKRGPAERGLLTLYWLSSGYGLRASRALGLLLAVLIVSALSYAFIGFEPKQETVVQYAATPIGYGYVEQAFPSSDQPSLNERLIAGSQFSLESGVSLLRGTEVPLTLAGTITSIFNRLLAPLLLGLALVSMRGRVKR